VGETISLNIWILESPKNVKIGVQCSDEEKMKFSKIQGQFQDVFAWYYEDLCDFDPGLIWHVIHIKEGIEPVRKKKKTYQPYFGRNYSRGVGKILEGWNLLSS
jgi:hypothetical protein